MDWSAVCSPDQWTGVQCVDLKNSENIENPVHIYSVITFTDHVLKCP